MPPPLLSAPITQAAAPGNNESAGRKRNSSVRKGDVHLKTALMMAAKSAVKKKGSYLRVKYYWLTPHTKPLQAQLAVAHKMLINAYHMLRDEQLLGDIFGNLVAGLLDITCGAKESDLVEVIDG